MSGDPQRSQREIHVFGPIAIFRRILRWHLTAPLWQLLILTAELLVLIAIAYTNQFGNLPHP